MPDLQSLIHKAVEWQSRSRWELLWRNAEDYRRHKKLAQQLAKDHKKHPGAVTERDVQNQRQMAEAFRQDVLELQGELDALLQALRGERPELIHLVPTVSPFTETFPTAERIDAWTANLRKLEGALRASLRVGQNDGDQNSDVAKVSDDESLAFRYAPPKRERTNCKFEFTGCDEWRNWLIGWDFKSKQWWLWHRCPESRKWKRHKSKPVKIAGGKMDNVARAFAEHHHFDPRDLMDAYKPVISRLRLLIRDIISMEKHIPPRDKSILYDRKRHAYFPEIRFGLTEGSEVLQKSDPVSGLD